MYGNKMFLSRGLVFCAAFLLFMVTSLSSGSLGVEHLIVEGPATEKLEGVITDPTGAIMPGVQIELYNHGELWFDKERGPTSAIRKKQKKLEEAVTDKEGRFRLSPVGQASTKSIVFIQVSIRCPMSSR